MSKRILGALALTLAASSAWGYQVRAIYEQPPGGDPVEADGQQIVTIQVERESSDAPAACLLDVSASAQQFASPPPDAATPGEDYTPTSDTFAINVGANDTIVEAQLIVPVLDDNLVEPTEFFAGVITDAVINDCDPNAVISGIGVEGSIPIFDDDDAPSTFVFANEPYRVNENEGPAVITLQRQGGTTGELTVFYRAVEGTATAGEDFTTVNGSVTWADGEGGERTFTVPILDDAEAEGAETVLIRATTDSDFVEFDETTLTIVDDESAATTSFATAEVTAATTDESVVLTLVRAGNTDGAVTVDYATADGAAIAGEDYVAAAGTVSWADGDGEDKTITVQLLPDPTREEPEDFQVLLSNVTGNATLAGNTSLSVTITGVTSRNIAEIPNLTPNQQALARWFDQTCGRLATLTSPTPEQQQLIEVCSVVRDAATGDATVREALDAINPEELLVSAFNALKLTAVQHGNLTQRLNALRKGARGVNLTGLQLDINGQQIAGNALQAMFDGLVGGGASADENVWGRWGAFVNGRLATGDKDESDNEAGFDFDLYGVTTGVDYRIRDNLIAGLSAGFGSVDTGFANERGGMDIDSWNAGAYLTYFREENFYLDALVTYGRNDYDSERNIVIDNALGSFSGTARGSTDGTQFSAGFGTGWDFSSGPWSFGPHGGAYYFDVDVDGFDEIGVAGLDLDIGDQSTKSLTVNAGGHVSYAILTDWGVLVPNAQVDWVHEFEDNRETLAFRFINDPFAGDPNDPSPTITLQSDRPDANYFVWSVGMSAQFIHGLSAFVNYQSYAGYSGVDIDEVSFGGRWEKTF